MNEVRNGNDPSRSDDALEQRAREWLAASVDALDATSVARLERDRRTALTLLGQRQQAARRRRTWLTAGALAASVLVAALLVRGIGEPPAQGPAVMQTMMEDAAAPPLEIFAAEEDAAIASDAEFYAWVDMDAASEPASGNGHT
jgi:predicted membrane-bound mannosyltransferase